MLSTQETTAAAKGDLGHVESFTCLVEGVSAYLQEVDGYRDICRRHEGRAAVVEKDGELRVARFFKNQSETVAYLRSAVQQLPSAQGPHRHLDGQGGTSKSQRLRSGRGTNREPLPCLVCRAISWEDRTLLVHASQQTADAPVEVDLRVLATERALPELPLRTLAGVLRCHEFLIPEVIATPLPILAGQDPAFVGIREYLARAMPPKLYASQCI
jgi:hypothetical protein